MKLLLDTDVLPWWLDDPLLLSRDSFVTAYVVPAITA